MDKNIQAKNKKRKYSFSEYNPEWVQQFNSLKDFLQKVFGDKTISIEHIGSTSVLGMKAKPIIDVLVVVEKMEDFDEEIREMESLGYEWSKNYIAPNTLLFFKVDEGEEKLENIHICPKGSPKTKQFLVMRDYLRSHPERAEEYSNLKEQNKEEHPDDYPAYRGAKKSFLQKLEQEAYEWHSKVNSKDKK